MEVIYHRLINKDLRIALGWYESEGGLALGDRFFEEAEQTVNQRDRSESDGIAFLQRRPAPRVAEVVSVPLPLRIRRSLGHSLDCRTPA